MRGKRWDSYCCLTGGHYIPGLLDKWIHNSTAAKPQILPNRWDQEYQMLDYLNLTEV